MAPGFAGNLTLGISPETTNQNFAQFDFSGFPNGINNMGLASDCAVTYLLTSAQLLALQTTAVQLVAPPVTSGLGNLVPPGGFLYVPSALTAQYKFGGTAYTIGNANNAFQIEYTGQATALLSLLATGLVDQAVGKVATNVESATGAIISATAAANLGLEVKLTGTTPALTLGNGTLYLNLLYNVIALY